MKELYISDAHIGLSPDGRLNRLMKYLSHNHPLPDYLEGVGDIFHLNEVDFDEIIKTQDFLTLVTLSNYIKVKIILGNHDKKLYLHAGRLPFEITDPYVDQWGYYHSHWHEYDPISKLPHWFHKWFGRLFGRKTPYQLLQGTIKNPAYLAACQAIHTRIIYEHKYKGYIGGHTHLPMQWILPDPRVGLWNCGDQVDSFTAILREDDQLRLIKL